jgi:hypothetical protein
MPGLTTRTTQLKVTIENNGNEAIVDEGGSLLVRMENTFQAMLKNLRRIAFQQSLITGQDLDQDELESQ